jgi:hypothetical protein
MKAGRAVRKRAMNNPIQGTAKKLYRGEFKWLNTDIRGLEAKVLAEYASNDLGFTILHQRCETGRHSTGVNIQNLPKKTKMNKQERNAAVRELDATEASIAKSEIQTAKLVAADRKKLDALEAKIDKRRAKLVAARDQVIRPLQRRAQYLRHELSAAF